MTTDDLRPDAESLPTDHRVKLRKEALIFEQPRHAVGLLAAACTLVGVIVGFSMGLLANRTQCHHVSTQSLAAQAPVVALDNAPGFLGVQIRSDLEAINEDDLVGGARVVQVIPNTPAHRFGIHAGDLIVEVDGEATPDMHALMRNIRARSPGQTVVVGLLRDGQRQTLGAPLAALPDRLRQQQP